MLNRVVLVGRITKDPEQKRTQNNIPVVSFTLAIDRQYSSESGDRQADFIQCVVWRKQAENMATYVKRYVTEVVCDSVSFLESKKQDSQPQPVYQVEEDDDPFISSNKSLASEEDLPF